jgi:hypothetical protein
MAVKTSWNAGDVLTAADLTDTFAAKTPGEIKSTAPTTSTVGYIWVNSSTYAIKVWDGSAWVDPSNAGGYLTAADVSGTTGSPTVTTTSISGVSYTLYSFTAASGSISFSKAGVIDLFMISAGGPGWNYPGAGGRVLEGAYKVASGTHDIVVGQPVGGDPSGAGIGKASLLGSLSTGSASQFVSSGTVDASTRATQYSTSITGTAVTYGRYGSDGTRRANRGDGGWAGDNSAGSSGHVIVRVKS